MSIKDLIAAAYNKDATSFESAFQSIMQDKVAAAVESAFTVEEVEEELDEAKKSEKDKEEEDEDEMCEDVDQIDELSKKTLGSYVKKASDNAASHAIKYGEKKAHSDEMDRMMNRHMSYDDKDKVRGIMKTTNKDVNAPREKAAKRLAGIDRAVDKLSK